MNQRITDKVRNFIELPRNKASWEGLCRAQQNADREWFNKEHAFREWFIAASGLDQAAIPNIVYQIGFTVLEEVVDWITLYDETLQELEAQALSRINMDEPYVTESSISRKIAYHRDSVLPVVLWTEQTYFSDGTYKTKVDRSQTVSWKAVIDDIETVWKESLWSTMELEDVEEDFITAGSSAEDVENALYGIASRYILDRLLKEENMDEAKMNKVRDILLYEWPDMTHHLCCVLDWSWPRLLNWALDTVESIEGMGLK